MGLYLGFSWEEGGVVPAAPLLAPACSVLTRVLSSTSQLLPAHGMSWESVFLPNALLLPWRTRVRTQRVPRGLQNSLAGGSGQPGGAPSACSLGRHRVPWLLAGWIYILGANSGLCGVRARCESAAGVAEGSWLGATEGGGGQAAARLDPAVSGASTSVALGQSRGSQAL